MALVRVGSFRDPYEAHIARSLLESAGIPGFVSNEHHVGMNWLYSNALGGVVVQVAEEHAEDALELLEQPAPETQFEEEWEESEAETCPRCGESAGRPSQFDTRVRAASMIVGVPLTVGRYRWRCASCGYGWRSVPPYRGLAHSAFDAAALALLALRWIVSLPIRAITAVSSAYSFDSDCVCWSCGATYEGGAQHCPGCQIDLPDREAYQELVEPGRPYDGACPQCHTPFLLDDYVAEVAQKLCSRCGAVLPE